MFDSLIFYIKYLVILILTAIRPYLSKTSTSGFGKKKLFSNKEKECVRRESDGFSIDAGYFNGFDTDGNFFGFGIQKRANKRCENVFFIRLKEFNEDPLVLPINPSTWTRHNPNEWETESGLKFSLKSPMKRWKIEFDGNVVEMNSKIPHKLKLEIEWRGYPTIFNADENMDRFVISRSIASEKWSKEFFENLRQFHQTHYEIFGETVACHISIDDKYQITNNKFISMKDRSYGLQRNWGDFRRYILHYLFTDDGLAIGCHFVSTRNTFSHLIVGFIINRKKDHAMTTVRHCSKCLSDLGETELLINGDKSFEFDITTSNGEIYNINLRVEKFIKFHCGENKDGTLYSCFVRGDVNGIRTVGMCEFEYNSEIFSHILV